MEKIWAPTDRVLSEIGRFVLLRPRISALLLMIAIILTVLSNGLFNSAANENLPVVIQIESLPLLENTTQNVQSSLNYFSSKAIQLIDSWRNYKGLEAYSVSQTLQQPFTPLSFNQTLYELMASQLDSVDLSPIHLSPQSIVQQLITAPSVLPAPAVAAKTPLAINLSNNTVPPTTDSSSSPSQTPKVSQPKVTTPAIAYVAGEVKHSIYTDAHKIGLSNKQISQLVSLFSGKGLAKNLSKGDQFSVLYQKAALPKQKNSGAILAAQLTHQGKNYQLIRFTDPKGKTHYYTPQGENFASESILRAPVTYKYISSGFSAHRFDPILRFVRPHVGVDYAAPEGTPVKAAGNGIILAFGYKGGYGNTIVIKHDDKYSTLYGHLEHYAANLKNGEMVQQGQIIGYVGHTGFATGPHLHYEIHMNNIPYNPLTVPLPNSKIPAAYWNLFLAQSKILLAQLNINHQLKLAERNDPIKKS